MDELIKTLSLLTSPQNKLFINEDEYISALLQLLPIGKTSFFDDSPKTYHENVKEELVVIASQAKEIKLTTEFSSPDIEINSIAYHRIKGMILSDSSYWFSSKRFEQDLLLADANPNINAHFLHTTSGGGEAWYLDRVAETMNRLEKPVYGLIEKVCASAAYYFQCHCNVIKSLTQNDTIGSIGTMVSFFDIIPFFESLGLRYIEEYAKKSDLKNKKINNLRAGKPEQYIKEELDPLQQQFETEVRNSRKVLCSIPEDDPIVRGETFDALHAIDNKLIDGICTLSEALNEAHEMGMKWANKNKKHQNLYSLI